MSVEINLRGNTVVADEFVGTVSGEMSAADVTVAAGTDGLGAGSVQEALQALATRVAAVEP